MRVCQSLRLVCQISYSQCISSKLPFVLFGFLFSRISRSLMAMSLNVPLMVYIYLNLFALPEHLRMLLTLIIVTNS